MRCCLCDIRVGSIDIHVVISVRGGLTENNYMVMRAWCCCKSSFVNVFYSVSLLAVICNFFLEMRIFLGKKLQKT